MIFLTRLSTETIDHSIPPITHPLARCLCSVVRVPCQAMRRGPGGATASATASSNAAPVGGSDISMYLSADAKAASARRAARGGMGDDGDDDHDGVATSARFGDFQGMCMRVNSQRGLWQRCARARGARACVK